MAWQQRLCFLYFLAVWVTGPCRASLPCVVRDANGRLVTGDLPTEGVYSFTRLGNACSRTIRLSRSSYNDSNVRMRILEKSAWIYVTISDGDGKRLAGGVNIVSNISESFQSSNSLIVSMAYSEFFKAQIEHFSVPGTPLNSSATRLTARDDMRYLTSFGYPIGYPNSLHFIYVISTPEYGHRVELVTDTLLMANPGEGVCSRDYVEVVQPYNTVRWCRGSPRTVSSGPEIVIIFHTDASGSQKGFRLGYRSIDGRYETPSPPRSGCSRFHEALGSTSYLAWPSYPRLADYSDECRWTIGTGTYSDYSVMVQFQYVILRDGDMLQLYDGSNAEDDVFLYRFYDGGRRRLFHSPSSSLTVVFRSSRGQSSRVIFSLSFKRVKSSYIQCNTTVTVESEPSAFKSSGVEHGVFAPFTCWYRFQASYGFAVSLESAAVSSPTPDLSPCPNWFNFYGLIFERLRTCASMVSQEDFPVGKRSVLVWFHAGSDQARFSFLLKEQAGNDEPPTTTAVLTPAPEHLARSTTGAPELKHHSYLNVMKPTYMTPPSYFPGPRHDVYIWTCNIDAAGISNRIRLQSRTDYWGWVGVCDFVDVFDGRDRTAERLAHWCGNEPLYVTSSYYYLYLEFRAVHGSRDSFVIEAELVPNLPDPSPDAGTPSAVNTTEAVSISTGVGVIVLLWIIFVVCLRRVRRRRRLRELRGNIDRMIVLQLEADGRVGARDDARPLLAAGDTAARPWWRRVVAREPGEAIDYDEAPPPYPGLPDVDPRETTPHDPPPPYTLSAHDVSIPTSDRPFLEQSRGAAPADSGPWGEENTAYSSPWGEDNMAANADSSPWGEENTADSGSWREENTADASPWGEDNMAANADSSPWGEENTADSSPWGEESMYDSDDWGPREDVEPSSDAWSPAAEDSTQAASDDVPCLLLRGDDDDENKEAVIRVDDERSDVP